MNEITKATTAQITAGTNAADLVNANPFLENLLKKAPNTITRHLKELRNFGAFLTERGKRGGNMQQPESWKDVTADDIHDYKNYMLYTRGLATSSVNQTIFIIRSYAALSAAHGGMQQSEVFKATQTAKGIRTREADRIDEQRPVSRASSKKATATIITKYQAEQLKHAHDNTAKGRRDALLMCLLLDLGLRISDVIALTMENIDMTARTISLKTKKTGTALNLSMTDDVYNAAAAYFMEYTPAAVDVPIWYGVNKHGQVQGTFSKHSAQMRVTALGLSLGIENFSAHDCRHYWVTAADRGGSSLLAITEAGGWSTPTMPARYVNKGKINNAGIKLG